MAETNEFTLILHTTPTVTWDFTIRDGRAHIGRVIFDSNGMGIRSTVMAGEFATTNNDTGITLDPVPASAMIQGF